MAPSSWCRAAAWWLVGGSVGAVGCTACLVVVGWPLGACRVAVRGLSVACRVVSMPLVVLVLQMLLVLTLLMALVLVLVLMLIEVEGEEEVQVVGVANTLLGYPRGVATRRGDAQVQVEGLKLMHT